MTDEEYDATLKAAADKLAEDPFGVLGPVQFDPESMERDRRTRQFIRDWQWSEALVQRPLPLIIVTGC